MLHPLLERYIPSRSYVEFLQKEGVSFSDFETAAILHQCDLPPEVEIGCYQELLESTADERLRRQLSAVLDFNRRQLALFRSGGAGRVYVTLSYPLGSRMEELPVAYADNYEAAYAVGKRCGTDFKIRLCSLLSEPPERPSLHKGYMNPNMLPEKDRADCVNCWEDDGNYAWPTADAQYRRDGTMLSFWFTEEDEDDGAALERLYSPELFTNAFVAYPTPFALGDAVRWTGRRGEIDETPGVVETSPEEWNDFLKRVKNGLYVDQSDASLTVEWLRDGGRFTHSHVPPIFLEQYEPENGAPHRALLESAAALLRGQGSLDWFTECLEEERKREAKEG